MHNKNHMNNETHEAKVPNPYAESDQYHCFGCDPRSPVGLRMQFTIAGEALRSTWEPRTELEGYPGVIHGGIQATLADEMGGWFLHALRGTAGVTRDLTIEYSAPALTEKGPFHLEATAREETEKEVTLTVTIHGSEGSLFSTATVRYAKFSEAVARRRLSFPGAEAFRPVGR